jgi:hypothetical protein
MTDVELRQALQQQLRNSGAVGSAKARLRSQLLAQLKQRDSRSFAQQHNSNALVRACDALVSQYLHWRGCEYSLSVFCPESGFSESDSSDAIALLSTASSARENQHRHQQQQPMLMRMAEQARSASHSADASVSADADEIDADAGVLPQRSVARQLEAIDKEYSDRIRQIREGSEISNEQRMLDFQRDAHARSSAEADERISRVRNVEVGRVRAEESEKRRRMINQARQELERKYSDRLARVKRREEALAERSRSQKREIERNAYEKRQELVRESERLAQRTRELEKQEHRMKERESALQQKEVSIEEREHALFYRPKVLEESAEEEVSIRKRAVGQSVEEPSNARTEAQSVRAEADEAQRARKQAEAEVERLHTRLNEALQAKEDALTQADQQRLAEQRAKRELEQERTRNAGTGERFSPGRRQARTCYERTSEASSQNPRRAQGESNRATGPSAADPPRTHSDCWNQRLQEIGSHEKRFNEELQAFKQRASRDRTSAMNALSTAVSEAETSFQPRYSFVAADHTNTDASAVRPSRIYTKDSNMQQNSQNCNRCVPHVGEAARTDGNLRTGECGNAGNYDSEQHAEAERKPSQLSGLGAQTLWRQQCQDESQPGHQAEAAEKADIDSDQSLGTQAKKERERHSEQPTEAEDIGLISRTEDLENLLDPARSSQAACTQDVYSPGVVDNHGNRHGEENGHSENKQPEEHEQKSAERSNDADEQDVKRHEANAGEAHEDEQGASRMVWESEGNRLREKLDEGVNTTGTVQLEDSGEEQQQQERAEHGRS